MADIVALHEAVVIHGEANPEIVGLLRELLRRAEAGEITAMALATIEPNGIPSSTWHAIDVRDSFTLIGAVSRLLYRLNNSGEYGWWPPSPPAS